MNYGKKGKQNAKQMSDRPYKKSYAVMCQVSSRVMFAFLLISIYSCSVTRKLPAHEKLYTGAKVKIDDEHESANHKKKLKEELEDILRPKPNTKLLGIPYKLMFYNMVDTVKNKKGLKHFIKNKLGEPPVLFSQVSLDANNKLLVNRLENRGYFQSRSSAEVIEKERKARVVYTAIPGPHYHIRDVKFIVDSVGELGGAVWRARESSFLKKEEPYDLDVIKAERERIDARLKEQGFYFFSPDNILVQVDSTVGGQQVDLFVRIKQETPVKARRIYRIHHTYILPEFSITEDTINVANAEKYKDFYIVDPENKWKPKTFERFIFFQPGDIYNRTDHNRALNNMVSIGAFKFVKNRFVELAGDSSWLDVYYYLTPLTKKSIRAEITGKKTDADFAGSDLSINWRNRNTFRGAELLTISAYTGADVQAGGLESLANRSYFKVGSQVTVTIPRFISPFKIRSKAAFVPKTSFLLGYDFLQRRQSYNLNSFRGSAGYVWKENVRKQHELSVIEIYYVHALNVTDQYRMLAETDATLKKAIENQFTIGPTYRYTFTNTAEINKIHTTYFMGGIDLSGNVTGLITGANIKEGREKTLFGAPFSQYIKLQTDFRYYIKLGENAKWANRVFGGFGYAYGNSLNLPYLKQFFIGGSNSIRAFRARTVGPGTYYAPDDPNTATGFTADQSGDIKLELNSEYRKRIVGILHGALFVDAGNIWLLNNDKDPEAIKPGALFDKDFYKELMVGGGAGLRLDLSFVILRFDVAFPFRKPWLPEGERWVFNEIRFGDPDWRKENLIFNVGIGYPF